MRPILLPTAALVLVSGPVSAAVTGCAAEPEPNGAPGSPISSQLQESTETLQCYARMLSTDDCDGDAVTNATDVLPGRADLEDDDGDTVINRLDRHPGLDDRVADMDDDGLADFQDTFFGDNHADADRDGLSNGFDPQPYAAPPSGTATRPPSGLSSEELTTQILLNQVRGKYTVELLGARPDRDYDGIPDDVDTTPTSFTNDRDNDGDVDFYDPEPGDPYIDSRNDPYDPGNDEYWTD